MVLLEPGGEGNVAEGTGVGGGGVGRDALTAVATCCCIKRTRLSTADGVMGMDEPLGVSDGPEGALEMGGRRWRRVGWGRHR